jgi:hypothetical protein
MAMAGQAQLERLNDVGVRERAVDSTRDLVKNAYYWACALAAVALIALEPPKLDLTIPILLSVVVVAIFLAVMERAQTGYQSSYAPLGAIIAAAVVALGGWALPLAFVGWAAVHYRLKDAGRAPLRSFNALAGQLGYTTFSIYAMLGVTALTRVAVSQVPVWATPAVWLIGIIAVGMVWHTINNAAVSLAFVILGRPIEFVRYWRAGFVASLWAYLLVAMFAFGGILAAFVFYVAVAHTRMFDRILSVVESADERDWVVAQFREVIRDLYQFLSPADVEFAKDVRYLSLEIARKVGLPKTEVDTVALAAEFHELGKCQLPHKLRTTENLTPAEQRDRMRYPLLGAKLLRKASRVIPEEVAYGVEHQCEAFDGTGYPHGMRGTNIPVGARIISIARDYVQLLTGHDGVKVHTKQDALKILLEHAGTQYDPALVDLLREQIA